MWTILAGALINFLGPLLWKFFQDWLTKRLLDAAAKRDAQGVRFASGPDKFSQLELLADVKRELYWFQFGKRAAVDAVYEAVKRDQVKALIADGIKIG